MAGVKLEELSREQLGWCLAGARGRIGVLKKELERVEAELAEMVWSDRTELEIKRDDLCSRLEWNIRRREEIKRRLTGKIVV